MTRRLRIRAAKKEGDLPACCSQRWRVRAVRACPKPQTRSLSEAKGFGIRHLGLTVCWLACLGERRLEFPEAGAFECCGSCHRAANMTPWRVVAAIFVVASNVLEQVHDGITHYWMLPDGRETLLQACVKETDPYKCLAEGPEGLTIELVELMQERLHGRPAGSEAEGARTATSAEARTGPTEGTARPGYPKSGPDTTSSGPGQADRENRQDGQESFFHRACTSLAEWTTTVSLHTLAWWNGLRDWGIATRVSWVTTLTGYWLQAYAVARMIRYSILAGIVLWCAFLTAYLFNYVFIPGATVIGEAVVALAAILMYLLGLWKWQGTPELQWYGPSAVRPYSTEFIQERVRARGDRRLPVDIVS